MIDYEKKDYRMVISIARQAVILKCIRQLSVMVGNYEFYYAAGLMNNIFGLDAKADMKPDELFDYLLANIGSCEAKDDKEEYLIKMISRYEPLETYDDQMKELFAWGETETDKWQVKTSRG
ncbi:MAG: DUF3837 domain-containing protein [Agathobacter sp.]|nr:DUF3837 domain-containing protein [Agathobacter sp.]